MDKNNNLDAYKVVNEYSYNELVNIFYKYGEEKPLCKFYKGTAFNENGIAIAEHNKEKLILFAEGYCIAFDDITKLALDRGFIESINNEVKEKCLKKTLK